MAKTRKKKTGTADAIHIDINSHNAKDRAKYRMMEESRNITSKDCKDGVRFTWAGLQYIFAQKKTVYDQNPFLRILYYNEDPEDRIFVAWVYVVGKTGVAVSRQFFDKRVKTSIKFKDMYLVE